MQALGFGGLGCGAWGLGLGRGVWCLGLGCQGLGFEVSGFGVWGVRVWSLGCQGFGLGLGVPARRRVGRVGDVEHLHATHTRVQQVAILEYRLQASSTGFELRNTCTRRISQNVFIDWLEKVNSPTKSSTYCLPMQIKYEVDGFVGELTF